MYAATAHHSNGKTDASSEAARARRVTLLVCVAAVLGLADLGLTLYFMKTMGMVEANPLARMLAAHGVWALAAFKVLTMVVNAGGLLKYRGRRSAELGAWVTAGVMFVLSIHWHGFAVENASLEPWEREFIAANAEFVCLAR